MALPLTYNVRNLRPRWKVTLLAIFGIGLVVAVFVTLLSMARGFRIALRSTGSPTERHRHPARLDVGADVVDRYRRRKSHRRRSARGARRDGKPMASCEVVILTTRPQEGHDQPANITFRGVTPIAFNVRNNVKIVEGRSFTPGLYEVIVGKKIADRVSGLDIG